MNARRGFMSLRRLPRLHGYAGAWLLGVMLVVNVAGIAAIAFILTTLTLSLAVSHAGQSVHFRELFLALRLIALTPLALLCLRGWRALQRRPQPFLSSAP
jgi:hypothetical protein